MIRIRFYSRVESGRHLYTGFKMSGHSGYAVNGGDIVCAAASAGAQIMLAAASDTPEIEADVGTDAEKALIKCRVSGSVRGLELFDGVVKAVRRFFETLAEDYPEYVAAPKDADAP